jgi:hypothetical protein
VARVEVLPHPHVDVAVLARGQQRARRLRVHALYQILGLLAAGGAGNSQGAHGDVERVWFGRVFGSWGCGGSGERVRERGGCMVCLPACVIL